MFVSLVSRSVIARLVADPDSEGTSKGFVYSRENKKDSRLVTNSERFDTEFVLVFQHER